MLVLGDSILEATSSSYGGEMCRRLVPHGWAVEIDAENGRDAGVGLQILEDRLDDGEELDAAVVMLGNNYRNDPEQFDEQIEDILDLLAPAPVLLLTVTEFEDAQAEVNYVLRPRRRSGTTCRWSSGPSAPATTTRSSAPTGCT